MKLKVKKINNKNLFIMKRGFLTAILSISFLYLNAQTGNEVMQKVFDNYAKNYFVNGIVFNADCLIVERFDKKQDTLCFNQSKWQLPEVAKKQRGKKVYQNVNKGHKVKNLQPDYLRNIYSNYIKDGKSFFSKYDFVLKFSDNDFYILSYKSIYNKKENKFTDITFKINKSDYAVTEISGIDSFKNFKKPVFFLPVRDSFISYEFVINYKQSNGKYVMDSYNSETLYERNYRLKEDKKENWKRIWSFNLSEVAEVAN